MKGTNVPATAVAGNEAIVAVRLPIPAELVYVNVVFVIAPPFVVAVVTNIPATTPTPLVLPLESLAGKATELIV